MKLVVFETEPRERAAFEALRLPTRFVGEALQAGTAGPYADAELISVFIGSRIDEAVLAQLPCLRLIATRSTGTDHIDLAGCERRGIVVCNVPVYGESTVAEHVFALLLTISHRMIEAVTRTRMGQFSADGLQGFDLRGRTLGVLGTGSIGRHVIRIAQGFGMPVLGCDMHQDPALAAQPGFRYVPFDTCLQKCDVLSLHVPATPRTRHLIGDAEFAQMKPGSILINTARGSIVDPVALIRALRSGRLAAAGLDVLPGEPEIREEAELVSSAAPPPQALALLAIEQALLHLPNVVVTPHSAFNTREAVQRIIDTTVANIHAFLEGAPQHRVCSSARSEDTGARLDPDQESAA